MNTCTAENSEKSNSLCAPFQADVPEYLCRIEALMGKKRQRRGVQGGRLVKLEAMLMVSPELLGSPGNIPQDLLACFHSFESRCNLAPLRAWLIPLSSLDTYSGSRWC